MSGSKANMTSPDIIWLTDDILFMTYFGELYNCRDIKHLVKTISMYYLLLSKSTFQPIVYIRKLIPYTNQATYFCELDVRNVTMGGDITSDGLLCKG